LLTDESLERCRLFVELSAGSSGLRGLQDRLLTLGPQAIEADDEFDQCVKQRQTHQQEAEQNELEE
jgi:hypothetical protein